LKTTSARESLWYSGLESPGHAQLDGDRAFDVCVIGGGIAGLTTALLVKREGARVAVIEADRVGRGVTGTTTGKVSALQATIYSTIRDHHGAEAAAVYAEASRAAVEQVAALAAEERIDCDLERRPAFTYAATDTEIEAVEEEARAVEEAGLAAELTDSVELPFAVPLAVRLDDQLQFHPVRYAEGLARAIDGDGSAVFEGTRATGVDAGAPCRVRTPRGTVAADRVVVATHFPILDRGLYFARLKAQRSYCIAARVRGEPPSGMSISGGSPTHSLRSHAGLLIVGGEGHSTGAREATPERFQRLEAFARSRWDVEEVTHRWSAQDPVPYDHLPMIGPYVPGSDRLLVTTGFMKWGLTTGTFGAIILRDMIAGRENAWASRFTPSRVSPRSLGDLAQLGAKFGLEFAGARLQAGEVGSAAEVPPGEGRVVRHRHALQGVFRDHDGAVHSVSLRCTHLGCLLRFNAAERSWDCPCHGSRFDVDGAVLEGPAVAPLERFDG
jgi:glycine/D-amino acid oxidase-like deaminating enzyme/nitrite reductase/ring-hydroxylating ferredoxin subunit